MKKTLALLVVVGVLCFGLMAQAQTTTPPPPTFNVSGTAIQGASHQSGDPTVNGAFSASNTSAGFTGTSSTQGLWGTGGAFGTASSLNLTHDNLSMSGFSAKGSAQTDLALGTSGEGSFSLLGVTQGQAYNNVGNCTTGGCAGAGATGLSGLNFNGSGTGGTMGGTAYLTSSGVAWTATGAGSMSSGAQVTSGACLTPIRTNDTTVPCPSGQCGG